MHGRRLLAISACLFVFAGRGAQAQRLAPLAVAVHPSAAPTPAERDSVADGTGSLLPQASRSALIGAGVGTVIGLGWAAIAPTDGTGHSDKGTLFLGLGTLGAVAGLLIGSMIGALLPG